MSTRISFRLSTEAYLWFLYHTSGRRHGYFLGGRKDGVWIPPSSNATKVYWRQWFIRPIDVRRFVTDLRPAHVKAAGRFIPADEMLGDPSASFAHDLALPYQLGLLATCVLLDFKPTLRQRHQIGAIVSEYLEAIAAGYLSINKS